LRLQDPAELKYAPKSEGPKRSLDFIATPREQKKNQLQPPKPKSSPYPKKKLVKKVPKVIKARVRNKSPKKGSEEKKSKETKLDMSNVQIFEIGSNDTPNINKKNIKTSHPYSDPMSNKDQNKDIDNHSEPKVVIAPIDMKIIEKLRRKSSEIHEENGMMKSPRQIFTINPSNSAIPTNHISNDEELIPIKKVPRISGDVGHLSLMDLRGSGISKASPLAKMAVNDAIEFFPQ